MTRRYVYTRAAVRALFALAIVLTIALALYGLLWLASLVVDALTPPCAAATLAGTL